MRLKLQPLSRQVGPGAGPGEQPPPHRRLQRLHPGGNGGLRDVQPLRRAVKAAGFDKVKESIQKFNLHLRPLIGFVDQ
jgi:hypothetical protein